MRSRTKRRIAGTLSIAILFGLLTGCATQEPKEKTVVKILYLSNFKNVEKLVESTYDDIDLQVEISPYSSEEIRRLEKGDGPDLVIAAHPDSNLVQKYLMDLSDTKTSAAYDGTIMNALKLEGKTYLIPFPGVYSGYIINETLFEEAGLAVPTSNEELVAALSELKEKGLGVGGDHANFSIYSDYNAAVGMFYVGCMVPDFLGTMEGVQWLSDFRDKKATFTGVWEESFVLSDTLAAEGLMDPTAISRQRNTVLCRRRLGNGTLAAAFGDSALYYECVAENKKAVEEGTSKEYSYRMLPLFSEEGNEPWFLFAPSALIGINNAISEEKEDACKRVLAILSTPEGQEALNQDLGTGISCLLDYEQTEAGIPAGVGEYVESGYIYNVLFPSKTVEYLGGCAREVLAGKKTVGEALKEVDKSYYEGTAESGYDFTVVGKMDHDLLLENFNARRGETELGNFIADCALDASGAQAAVINGGGIRASFYEGVVYGGDLSAVCPFDNKIIVLEMKGQTVWDMLEKGLETCSDEFPGGSFLQISGLQYNFDSSRPSGSRLVSVKMPDGSDLDPDGEYQVAVNDYMAGKGSYAEGNGDGFTMLNYYDDDTPKGSVTLVKDTGLFYRDAMALYFEKHGDAAVDVRIEGRICDLAQDK
ncbi:extracellular solute-binding protein [Clostridium sp. AF19-22AC]|jgi:5'-nucleotidase/UDP-sugar diphosphatase|uniref:extracellular solute-binding protein n=1 Tax=Clostridia TaxID=186801 RepID=UPI000E4AE54E|nr:MULTISPECIES: extracellular solute-binding protein [Clostridia]RHR33150.1 extracellular solute-binding protein [Clostridium sp. AF19-22AC]